VNSGYSYVKSVKYFNQNKNKKREFIKTLIKQNTNKKIYLLTIYYDGYILPVIISEAVTQW